VDASDIAIGIILMQKYEKNWFRLGGRDAIRVDYSKLTDSVEAQVEQVRIGACTGGVAIMT
jgi:hypothetical protein